MIVMDTGGPDRHLSGRGRRAMGWDLSYNRVAFSSLHWSRNQHVSGKDLITHTHTHIYELACTSKFRQGQSHFTYERTKRVSFE